ncbi:SSI family serine proteinase inhibitor [Blastococcus sp. CCUG 61487]|uniref:SSI family serine proteinase inhibitor n=1 Tax=Blastococcus sp. CCUG 61487 TaxID=1840703 RepID=UPI00113DA7B3|nr:SSI family serine proteinase inhibitor [Blastococcus sp. CCUG 61487]TKJ19755.1 hypothetical protein A6V29_09920 [Blastococcus sp. CCUG 61487]
MRRLLLGLLPVVVLALAGCGSADEGEEPATPSAGAPDGDGGPAAGGISQAENDLQVRLDLGDGSPAQLWTLTCAGVVEGSHPDAPAACEHLAGLDDPFAPLPEDVWCTQQYGGPQTATIAGRWAGQQVDLAVSRVDGCRIAQWDSLVPLLPPVDGADLVG